jgi:beta-lactam-binding protein with PASTA domain
MSALRRVADRLRQALPSDRDLPENRVFKLFLFAAVGLMFVVVIAAVLAFLFSLEGAEETLVPDVAGTPLIEAMLAIQEKGLNTTIQLRTTSDPSERGTVLAQEPAAGSLVRAGRRINLIVSQGAVIEEVDDFAGRTLEEVRTHLRTVFPSQDPLLRIGDIVRLFDEEPAGTVVRQRPEAGTRLTTETELDLWVSRGPDVEQVRVPSFGGLAFEEARTRLAEQGYAFVFELAEARPDQQGGVVVGQSPLPGVQVAPRSRITLEVTPPGNLPEGLVFGLFERTLPEFAVPVEIRVDITSPEGEVRTLFSMEHPGGPIAVPFVAAPGSVLELFQLGEPAADYVVPDPAQQDDG